MMHVHKSRTDKLNVIDIANNFVSNGAAICFIPEFFGIKFPEIFGDFLKKARGGFFDLLEGMWDHFATFGHRLDTLTTPPASLCGPKGPRKPWIPEIFGKTTLNFW